MIQNLGNPNRPLIINMIVIPPNLLNDYVHKEELTMHLVIVIDFLLEMEEWSYFFKGSWWIQETLLLLYLNVLRSITKPGVYRKETTYYPGVYLNVFLELLWLELDCNSPPITPRFQENAYHRINGSKITGLACNLLVAEKKLEKSLLFFSYKSLKRLMFLM